MCAYIHSPGPFGDTLRYAGITVDLAFDSQSIDYSKGHAFYQQWEDWISTVKSTLPPPLQSIFQATPYDHTWEWVAAQAVCVRHDMLYRYNISY